MSIGKRTERGSAHVLDRGGPKFNLPTPINFQAETLENNTKRQK